jgi:hypothetical protein
MFVWYILYASLGVLTISIKAGVYILPGNLVGAVPCGRPYENPPRMPKKEEGIPTEWGHTLFLFAD